MRQIILASSSPRREEILKKIRLPFIVKKSYYKENNASGLSPDALVKKLAFGKAEKVSKKYKNSIIIAADTLVVLKDKVLGKPATAKQAKDMLVKLQGKSHIVITGVCVMDADNKKIVIFSSLARVFLKPLTVEQINTYIKTGEWTDKAGGYGMQDYASMFVKKVEGDFLGAVGLPISKLVDVLEEFGIKII